MGQNQNAETTTNFEEETRSTTMDRHPDHDGYETCKVEDLPEFVQPRKKNTGSWH